MSSSIVRSICRRLAASPNWRETLAEIVRCAVPKIADCCALIVTAADGEIYCASYPSMRWCVADPQVLKRILQEAVPLAGVKWVDLFSPAWADWAEALEEPKGRYAWAAPLEIGESILGLILGSFKEDQPRLPLAVVREFVCLIAAFLEGAWYRENYYRVATSRDDLMIAISHELKTPLTVLRLQFHSIRRVLKSTDYLALKGDEQVVKTSLLLEQDIDRQLTRLETHVQNVVEASRARSGVLLLRRERLDFSEIMKTVLRKMGAEFNRSGSRLELDIQSPAIGYLDRDKIEETLTNILLNSAKYGRGKPIQIALSSDDQRVRLFIRDSGIGIQRKDQDRIFGRFERGVSPMAYSGLGLGLYVARSIVSAHGGEIQIESPPGEGTTVLVSLPVHAPVEGPASSRDQQFSPRGNSSGPSQGRGY